MVNLSSTLQQLMEIIPDCFPKDLTSNLTLLLLTVYDESSVAADSLKKIEDYRDIDTATGYTLDKLGENVLIERSFGESDNSFRDRVKLAIASNLSKGDVNTLNLIFDTLLGEKFVRIYEGWGITENPAEILIEISGNEFSEEDFNRILFISNYIRAAGVNIASLYIFIPIHITSEFDIKSTALLDLLQKNYLNGETILNGEYKLDGKKESLL